MMTKATLALVHLAKKQLGWDEEMYRAVLRELGGVASAKDLTTDGFDAVMEYAAARGFKSDWRKRTFGHRPGKATPRQVELIRALWRQWSGGADDAALNRWMEKFYGCSALRFASPDVASKAINGLKSMISAKKKKARAAEAAGARGASEAPDLGTAS